MAAPYQVFEPATLPGEVVLVGEFATLPEALVAVSAGDGRTVEWRDGGAAICISQGMPLDPGEGWAAGMWAAME